MTDQQMHAITSLSRCTFLPGSWEKRFVRSLKDRLDHKPHLELSESQARWLMTLLHRYRKQHGRCFCDLCKKVEADSKKQLVLF